MRIQRRLSEMGLSVRTVKGQWPDPKDPGIEMRTGFLRVVDRIAGSVPHARVATHDPYVARAALMRLAAAGMRSELELLFGLPFRQAIPVAAAAGVPVRIYVSYGHAWLPYALHQLRENPRIAVWLQPDQWAGDPRTLDSRLEAR